MVSYGPWIDPPLIEETITVGYADLSGSTTTRPVTKTITPGSTTSGVMLGVSRYLGSAFDILNPASATPDPAWPEYVWDTRLPPATVGADDAVTFIPNGDGGHYSVTTAYLRHTGSHELVPPGMEYAQGDGWEWGVGGWALQQTPATPLYNPTAAGIPTPTGATGWEYEVYGQPADLENVTLDPPSLSTSVAPYWTLRVAHGGTAHQAINGLPVTEVRGLDDASGGYTLNTDELSVFQTMLAPAGGSGSGDQRRVRFALTYSGPYPGDLPGAPTIAGSMGDNWFTTADAEMTLRVAFRVPRYRWIFDSIPYRRVFPRDDGLAGGAPRTYPRPKSQQSSNRIVGAIF